MSKIYKINVRLSGVRPMMFDRYSGDNSTELPPEEKMYLTRDGQLTIPAMNIFSMLCATNSNSVAKMLWKRGAKPVAMAISAYCDITPYEIPIYDDSGPVYFAGFDDQISVAKHVAKLKNGIPNPKVRPVLSLPWALDFEIEYQENKDCTIHMLRQSVEYGGRIGLGTFRPQFGRYRLERFDVGEVV